MTRQFITVVLLAGAASFACSGDKPSPAPPTPGGGATATAGIPPAAGATAGSGTGIAECDEYIRKYESCVRTHVPAAQRDQLEQGLEQYRATWRAAAANAQARPALATTCRQALTTAKMAMGAYGCQW